MPFFRRVPFLGQPGEADFGQIIDARSHSTVGAPGSHSPLCGSGSLHATHGPGRTATRPFLTSRQYTPASAVDFLVGCHSLANSGNRLAESVSPGHAALPEQYGQSGVAGGAVVHRYLPAVAFSLPPDLFRAAVGNGFRGKGGEIGRRSHWAKQFRTVSCMAEGR